MTKKKSPPKKKVNAEFFRFTYQVDFLIMVDGKPQKVMSSDPIPVMAADFEDHVMNIPEMKKMVEAQVAEVE